MQRTILKFLGLELLERTARLDALVMRLAEGADEYNRPAVQLLTTRLASVKDALREEVSFYRRLFEEKASREKEASGKKLYAAVYAPYEQLCQVSQWLPMVCPEGVLPETGMFLRDVMPAALLGKQSRPALLIAPHGVKMPLCEGEAAPQWMGYLQRTNPLAWPLLVERFAQALVQAASPIAGLRSKARGLLAERDVFDAAVAHAVGLRLLGPAYYFSSLQSALMERDRLFLASVEPLLFVGLNYWNTVDKSMVIVHEAMERARELFDVAATPETYTQQEASAIFQAVEATIGDKFAFAERSFNRAQALKERVNGGVLLGAAPLYPAEEIRSKLPLADDELAQASGEDVYGWMGLMAETPNTPREIVNAGWMARVEKTSVSLFEVVAGDTDFDEALSRLGRLADERDHLLQKSIETAEVHRMLLTAV